jgi:putative effector of murein hydrolase LrgA (UPF0299 family)
MTSLLFMFLPQAMELRYYMTLLFIPSLVAVSGQASRLRQLMRWIVVAGVWLGLFAFRFLSDANWRELLFSTPLSAFSSMLLGAY